MAEPFLIDSPKDGLLLDVQKSPDPTRTAILNTIDEALEESKSVGPSQEGATPKQHRKISNFQIDIEGKNVDTTKLINVFGTYTMNTRPCG